jgi:P27 family predicted phage terminase small subunit
MGLLTVADAPALERMCSCYAKIRTLEAALTREGLTYRSPVLDARGQPVFDTDGLPVFGLVRMRPEVAALDAADKLLKSWLSAFGLTPADRSRVAATPDGKPDPGAHFLD